MKINKFKVLAVCLALPAAFLTAQEHGWYSHAPVAKEIVKKFKALN